MSIVVRNLSFGYDNVSILKDVNFSASSGEFVGILGANGCGKSTLLKNILNLIKPQSGSIEILGKNLKEYSSKELARLVGFVPQKSALSMSLLVEDVVLMGRFCHLKSQFSGYDKSDLKKADEVMQLLDIKKFAKRIANTLSGGEFGRVMLARSIVSEPRILLLDEPTSALDLSYAVQMLKICKELTNELNLLTISVLHDLNLATLFCDKIFMLKDGKVAYKGSSNELYRSEILDEIYHLKCDVVRHKDLPFVLPMR